MDKRRAILFLLNTLVVLIFIDLIGTLSWITIGIAEETNPLMDFFLKFSPLLFASVKLVMSFMGVYVLYLFRKRFSKTIFYSSLALTLIYMMVALHHINGIAILLR